MRILILFIFLLYFPALAFPTTIRCEHPDYAGKILHFYQPTDPITGEKELMFTLQFNNEGVASATLKNTTTIYTFSDFGTYRGMLFLEPNTSIIIKLPPFRKKSFADEKNPYFSPVGFWFISEQGEELNDKISRFEHQINYLSDKYFNQLFFQQSKSVFDTVQHQLNQNCPEKIPPTLTHYKKLKTEALHADIFRLQPEAYSAVFRDIRPEFWLHPSFISLFTKAFNEQLSFSAKSLHGSDIFAAVARHDIHSLLKFVETKYKLSGKMAELVLLKLLHDGYYSNDFSKSDIKQLVSNNLFTKNTNAIIQTAAQNCSEKFSFLQQGSEAAAICLNNLNDKEQCTNANTTKFKYIVFADVETVVCKEHLKYLSRINELFNKHLEIFIVLRDTDNKEAVRTFFETNDLPAHKLMDTGNNFANSYKIRSYPQCFLLNEKHQVVFTNTKAPLDGFEQQFGSYLRQELFMRQRNQSR